VLPQQAASCVHGCPKALHVVAGAVQKPPVQRRLPQQPSLRVQGAPRWAWQHTVPPTVLTLSRVAHVRPSVQQLGASAPAVQPAPSPRPQVARAQSPLEH
jgi:hypothetical protein